MTNEEKQALIKFIQREKVTCAELDTRDFVEPEMDDFMRYGAILEIALAYLTAQPVKLEPIIHTGYTQDEIICMCNIRNDDIKAIRAAGHKVQE